MGDLDSLNVRITASAGDANKAIDELIKHLTALNGALNNFKSSSDYMKGLNNLVSGLRELRINLNGLDVQKTKDVAKAMKSLASAGESLAKLNGLGAVTENMTKGGDKLFAFSDKARKEAERLAKEFNFDDKGGVDELAQAIENLYSSVGDDDEVRQSMKDIDDLIEKYSRYKNELHEVAKARVEAIRSTHGKLNSDWQEFLGGDYESARRNRAKLGIRNTSKEGGSAGNIIGENTQILGVQEAELESENLAKALEILEANAYDAEHAMVGFHEVSMTVSGGLEAIRSAADGLVTSLGIDAQKIREMTSAASEVDDFMNIDIPDEEFASAGSAAQTAAPAIENVAQAEEQAATAAQSIEQVGNPFAGIVEGLHSLADINPSDSLANLNYIKNLVSKIGGDMGAAAGTALSQISAGLRSFDGLDIPDFGDKLPNLASGLRALGTGNIVKASTSLAPVAAGLRSLSDIVITTDVERVANLAHAISRFGLANMTKSIQNIPQLSTALRGLIESLSNVPQVSDNTIRLVEAMSNLNVNSMRANNGMTRLSSGLKAYHGHCRKAQSATKSLAAIIGKIYASYWLLFRAIGRIGKAINLASDLKEVQNVVDVTFADMNEKMNDFAKNAVDTLGMSELTAKRIGSKYQAMGSAMGITKDMVKNTNDFVQMATKGYADVADSMADISINLTRLAGDMASFYNQDYEEVAEKLQAVFTGQTRPLRAYGIDLTQATLKEWALANGLDADIKKMTQAEKTLLRYQYVMAQTTAAHGDFARTADTWANSIRIAQERLKQLGIILGQIAIYTFKPLVQSFNEAMKKIIDLATKTLNALGKIFGWQIEWSDTGVLRDEEEEASDLADDMGDAADNAKKFKNFLLGIDELNVLPDKDDKNKDKSGAVGLGAGLGDLTGGLKIKPIEKGFESLYDTLYKLGKRIAEVMKDLLKNIDWDAVYKKARRFGKGLAQFLNGYLSDAELFYEKGRFIANGINTIANAIDAFFHEFNGWQLGVDIGSYINGFTENLDWNVIRSAAYEMAHDIAQTINGAFVTIKWDMVGKTIANGLNTAVDFLYTIGDEVNWSLVGRSLANGLNGMFSNFDFRKAGQTINKWAKGFLDLIIAALDTVNWKMVGTKIGEFIGGIDFVDIAVKIAPLLWKAINAAVSLWTGMFKAAPIATALATAFASGNFRRRIGTAASGLARYIGKSLSNDLGKVFSSFGGGFTGYFANMDALGLTGNNLSGIASGFNSISSSISLVTKAIGGLTVGFAELFVVKDAIKDIVIGTDNLGASIAELGAAVGVAGVAFSALFGVPAGLLITGVVAATGAFIGMDEAMDEISENKVISVLSEDLGEAGITLNELAVNFQTAADNIVGGVDKMNAEHDRLTNMKGDLADMLGGLSLIEDAANSGNHLTSEALHELVDNLGEVKSAWEDYIKAQYDYLIQSTINNKNFITSQRELTDEEAAYFTKKINALTQAKYDDVEATGEMADAAEKAWQEYFDASKSGSVPTDVLNNLYDAAVSASNQLYGLAEATNVINDEKIASVNKELLGLSQVISTVSFSDIDPSNLDNYATVVKNDMDVISEAYRNATEKIDEHKLGLMSEGMSEEDAEIQTREYYNRLTEYASNGLESVQASLYDKFYKILATGDYVSAEKFGKEVITPFVNSFPNIIDSEGNKIKPTIGEAYSKLMSGAWESVYDYRDEGVGNNKVRASLSKGWQELFWNLRDDVAPSAKKAGEEVAKPFGEGIKSETENASKNFDDVSKTTKDVGKSAGGAASSLLDVKYAMADVNSISHSMKSGVVDLGEAFGRIANEGKNVSQTAIGLKSVDDTIRQFSGQLPTVQSGFSILATTMKENLLGMDVSFKQLYVGIMTNGQKTVAWFKSAFIPMFDASYWSGILSGIPVAFTNAFTLAVNNAKNIWMQFAKWANENMKMEVGGKKEGGKSEVNLKFPAYAKGGFPEDGMFFANHSEMVGSFSNGRTAVANNEQITEGIERAVYRAMSEVMSNVGTQPVNVELRGDAADFFSAMVKENNRAIMRTGASPIRV